MTKIIKENSSLRGELVDYSDEIIVIKSNKGISKVVLSEVNDIKIDTEKLSFDKLRKMESL